MVQEVKEYYFKAILTVGRWGTNLYVEIIK